MPLDRLLTRICHANFHSSIAPVVVEFAILNGMFDEAVNLICFYNSDADSAEWGKTG